MKDESVSALLASGEIQKTDDIIFMIDAIMAMFDRGTEPGASSQFITYAMQMLELWRDSLEATEDMEASDQVLNIVMGKQ